LRSEQASTAASSTLQNLVGMPARRAS